MPYVVAGVYAIYEHTGIYRKTKDLDLFFEPSVLVAAARAFRAVGFVTRLEDPHWLAKATMGEHFVDLIYGMGNGLAFIDEGWIRHSRTGILAACPVRIAPAEELTWHRLFISERHRHDMSDIVHLILRYGETLDWERLVDRVGDHWPLLLSQVLMFHYVYPGYRTNVPAWVPERLLERARGQIGHDEDKPEFTRGPLIARFSFVVASANGASAVPARRPCDRRVRVPPFEPSLKLTSGTSVPRTARIRGKSRRQVRRHPRCDISPMVR